MTKAIHLLASLALARYCQCTFNFSMTEHIDTAVPIYFRFIDVNAIELVDGGGGK